MISNLLPVAKVAGRARPLTHYIRIEVISPRRFYIWEQVLVTICGDRGGEFKRVILIQHRTVHINIAMGSNRCNSQEKLFLTLDSSFEEGVPLLSNHVGTILAFIAHRCISAALEGGVHIVIGIWIEQEVLFNPLAAFPSDPNTTDSSRETCRVWRIVVRDSMHIEQFAGIVHPNSRFLKPNGYVVLVVT